jgi:purine-cytosine permease-like protein
MAATQPQRPLVIKTRTDGVSPVSPVVLGLAGLVSAPALWAALVTGDLPVADALVRFLIAWLACAFGVALLAAAVGPRQRPARPTEEAPAEDADAAADTMAMDAQAQQG